MPVYLSCSSFNNRVHCQSWSCWADEIQWSRVQYVHQRDPWCALESDERARLAKLTSWTRAADVQKNLGFTHWRWNASPISRWNWDNCESAAPSCQLLIHSTCICIWVAYSCIYIYVYNTEIQKAHDIARMDQLQNCEISDKCTWYQLYPNPKKNSHISLGDITLPKNSNVLGQKKATW